VEQEWRVIWPDGSVHWILGRFQCVKDAAGQALRLTGVNIDITARRQAEENYRQLAETLDAEVRARTRQLEERNTEILRQSEQVRELSWRLLRAQDEERRHIARELHDSAGQTLTVLGMNLAQFVQKTGRTAPEVAGDAETIQEMVQQLHRDIRTTSYLLHPPLLDESGLYSALSWYTQGLVERSGLQIDLDMSPDFGRLHADMELVVFRLIQECLTNIHRHSGSKLASIRIVREPGQVTVEVRDHGKGMSPERLAQVQSGASGVGIRGMRERLRQFKGELKIESDSSGTRIFVTIPVLKSAVPEDENKAASLPAAV
jgi:signal transduction histidine kinase